MAERELEGFSPRRAAVRVKICGVTRAVDALAAEAAGADAVGVILWGRSKRLLRLEQAEVVVGDLGPFVQRVGVVVDAPGDFVLEAVKRLRLGAVQFHGTPDPRLLADLRQRIAVIRALPFTPEIDVDALASMPVDALVIDGRRPGSGETFDWSAAYRLRALDRWLLAGGLTPANVEEALSELDPLGVDVSSGVESVPGIKDHGAVARFVATAKSAR